MKDGIKDLQLDAMWYIEANHLEEEYNKYWASGKGITGYTLIDFVIDYCQRHAEEIRKQEEQERDQAIDDTLTKLSDNIGEN